MAAQLVSFLEGLGEREGGLCGRIDANSGGTGRGDDLGRGDSEGEDVCWMSCVMFSKVTNCVVRGSSQTLVNRVDGQILFRLVER